MNKRITYILALLLTAAVAGSEASAQLLPERKFIRKGNRDYKKGDYPASEIDYLRAKGKDSLSFAAGYNLGNAYYKQGRFDEAATAFSKPAPRGVTPESTAHSFYNAGNAQFQQRKLEEALESYKQSLRINPSDLEAKFNLAYVKKLLEEDKQDDRQNQDDKDDQNQNDQKDQQDQNDNQDKNDPKEDQNNQDQNDPNKDDQTGDKDSKNDGQNPDQDKDQGQDGQQPSDMTREEAEQMLQAIEMGDEKTREKVDAQKGRAVGGSDKNW